MHKGHKLQGKYFKAPDTASSYNVPFTYVLISQKLTEKTITRPWQQRPISPLGKCQ